MDRKKFLKTSLLTLAFSTVHGADRSGKRAATEAYISPALG